jgi:hypothetical protein
MNIARMTNGFHIFPVGLLILEKIRKKNKSKLGKKKRTKLSNEIGIASDRYFATKPLKDKLNVDNNMKVVALVISDIIITSYAVYFRSVT